MQARALLPLLTSVVVGSCGTFPADWPRDHADALEAYKQRFRSAVGDRVVETLDRGEFLSQARDVDVLWLGDHHLDVGLHARWLALIDDLATAVLPRRRPVLALECVGTADQPAVDAFLAGTIDLGELRTRIRARWPGSWLDSDEVDAVFYRDLLHLARARDLAVVALEPTPRLPLERRTAVMATSVRTALARPGPAPLVIAVVGQAHLLGTGGLAERIRHPAVTVIAMPEGALAAAIEALAATAPRADFARTERGTLVPIRTAVTPPLR